MYRENDVLEQRKAEKERGRKREGTEESEEKKGQDRLGLA